MSNLIIQLFQALEKSSTAMLLHYNNPYYIKTTQSFYTYPFGQTVGKVEFCRQYPPATHIPQNDTDEAP